MNFDALRKILDEEVMYYTDKLNPTAVYVEYCRSNGSVCFEPIDSEHFSAFLGFRYRQLSEEDACPRCNDLLQARKQNVIYLQDHPVDVHKRVAGNLTKKIAYFLADDKWQTVLVTDKGWTIIESGEIKFLKRSTDAVQVFPISGGNYLKLIRPYLNMTRDDALLYAVFIAQAFSRRSSHFAAVISSSKGTGKSTLTKITADIIDPSIANCAVQPSTEDNLKTFLANSYLASFDNTAPLSESVSNILCAAITGSRETKRKLYSDADQIVLSLHNLVVINGINVVPRKSDLAERSLFFELLPISNTKRKTEADIWRQFYQDRPKILGAIFDALSKAMQILPTLRVEKLHRMADAHKEMIAIALALGISQEEFQRILKKNIQKLQNAYADNNPFVDFVLGYMQTHPKVEMAAEELYSDMRSAIVGDNNFFPKSSSWLSRRLNEERDALFAAGYEFTKSKKQECNFISIRRIPKSQQTKTQKINSSN